MILPHFFEIKKYGEYKKCETILNFYKIEYNNFMDFNQVFIIFIKLNIIYFMDFAQVFIFINLNIIHMSINTNIYFLTKKLKEKIDIISLSILHFFQKIEILIL